MRRAAQPFQVKLEQRRVVFDADNERFKRGEIIHSR
jgi:hypothetical protein